MINFAKNLRVIGFDDAPFNKNEDELVNISGVVCSNARFEGMLWGEVSRDGINATETLFKMVSDSKFYAQIHAVLIDGLAFGGFNLVDLPELSRKLALPCIAVMRKAPNFDDIEKALDRFSDKEERKRKINAAGEVYFSEPFFYQISGCDHITAKKILERVTDNGHVPEALRLAHLIGSAVKTGQSSSRA